MDTPALWSFRQLINHTLMMASTPDIAFLEQLINPQRIVKDLVEMVRCASVNPFDLAPSVGNRESEFAKLYLAKMTDAGLEVASLEVLPGRSNVWGRLRANESLSGKGPR